MMSFEDESAYSVLCAQPRFCIQDAENRGVHLGRWHKHPSAGWQKPRTPVSGLPWHTWANCLTKTVSIAKKDFHQKTFI